MKFNIPDALQREVQDATVRIGNVYPAKGGKGTAFFVVVAIHKDSACLLGIDRDGNITSCTSYYKSVLEGGSYREPRPIMGFVEGLEELTFDVQWGNQS